MVSKEKSWRRNKWRVDTKVEMKFQPYEIYLLIGSCSLTVASFVFITLSPLFEYFS